MASAPSSLYSNSDFDAAFTSMARSAGVSDIADVVERFKTQKSTFASLEEQQTAAESDVREMGKLKEELEKEFGEVRLYYCCHFSLIVMAMSTDTLDKMTAVTPGKR